ncbi:hypothetical protein K1Y77_08835 [Halomonas qaidamensis]|uniref:Uncharacterized protein n=1 Tax=Halomonas qaidamensis TaxID=2866211 RepID=A0ABY6JJU1_9GAMM|nr:hypothetical protein [Halomonas qaidamensis]UYV17615.1 hypothetical protein K1Y77_08835 [Halomonas qaidamensis]
MKDKIEKALVSPGWIRLWLVASGVYFLFILLVAIGQSSHASVGKIIIFTLGAGLLPPALAFGLGHLTRWIIRGFLSN